jgi:hypothetical protein
MKCDKSRIRADAAQWEFFALVRASSSMSKQLTDLG